MNRVKLEANIYRNLLFMKIIYKSTLSALCFGISLFSPKMYSQEKKEKLNVLFIIADDLTTTALSCYENTASITPHINALAAEGTRYTKAYSQYPVCGPSRASFMFGYYPNATGTYGYVSGRENVGNDKKSWSQLFKDNGYYSARVSKIYHMGIPIDIENGTNGKDDEMSWTERFNSQGPEWKSEGEAILVQNNRYGTIERKGGNVMTVVKAEGDDLLQSDAKTAAKATQLIKQHKDEPFFLAVGLVRPHVPFVAPKRFFDAYPHNEMVVPPNVTNDWDDIPSRGINYVTSVNGEMGEEEEQRAIAGYYASVAFMDDQVGKLLNTLKEEGLEDNTVVVFTSDHGFHLGEHRFWMKVSLHEESVRVPLIIKMPGKAPAVCNSFVELLDLYPTVASLANISYSDGIQGKDISKTLDAPDYKVRDFAFSVTQGGKSFLIRNDKWAYIQYDEDAGSGKELYNMELDEKQYNNLANNPAYKQVVKEMQSILAKKLKSVRDNDL